MVKDITIQKDSIFFIGHSLNENVKMHISNNYLLLMSNTELLHKLRPFVNRDKGIYPCR